MNAYLRACVCVPANKQAVITGQRLPEATTEDASSNTHAPNKGHRTHRNNPSIRSPNRPSCDGRITLINNVPKFQRMPTCKPERTIHLSSGMGRATKVKTVFVLCLVYWLLLAFRCVVFSCALRFATSATVPVVVVYAKHPTNTHIPTRA